MITLYQTPLAWGTPNLSPFCFKLESYFRMTGLPYEVRLGQLGRAPKGKVPYVDIEGTLMGDSHLIIEHLKSRYGDPLDSKLTPEQKAIGHVVRRTFEESIYWYVVYMRWADDEGWRAYLPIAETMVPQVIGAPMSMPKLREYMLHVLHDQGVGRYSMDEVQYLAKQDLTAVSTLMGDKPFLLGKEPSSFDAVVYAFLVGILANPAESDVKQFTLSQTNLVRFCARFKSLYFANWVPPTRLEP
jgi:glutathione S-transferase